jgi:hypothetical protein
MTAEMVERAKRYGIDTDMLSFAHALAFCHPSYKVTPVINSKVEGTFLKIFA